MTAARFYIQSVIAVCSDSWLRRSTGGTNYLTLIDDLRHFGHAGVNLVTFNYDLLLDAAVQHFCPRPISHMDDYLSRERFALFKLHGSVNWGRVVTGPVGISPREHMDQIAHALIGGADRIRVSDNYRLVSQQPFVAKDDAQTEVLLPAIAVPMRSKLSFECPRHHLAELERRIQRTTAILILGWRGMDEHFVKLLAQHLRPATPIQIVCGTKSDGEATANALRSARGDLKCEALDLTFSEYILGGAGAPFLKSSATAQ